MTGYYYFDPSATVRLMVGDASADAMAAFAQGGLWFSCDLARTEVVRAIARRRPDDVPDAITALHTMVLISLTKDMYEMAGRLQPARLRSLDAIHVAAALSLGDDLTAFITYDDRQAEAARLNGLRVVSPGVNWPSDRRSPD